MLLRCMLQLTVCRI